MDAATLLPASRLRLLYRVALSTILSLSAYITPSFAQYPVNSYVFSTTSTGLLEDVTTPTGSLIGSASDDAASSVTNIGFSFNYAGVNYTQFSVSSNGLMALGSTPVATTATNALATGANVKIMPYWDDLSTSTTGSVVYKLTGTAPNRKLVVDWFVRVPKNNAQAANTHFQCWLEETTNAITFVYGAAATNTGAYTIGVTSTGSEYYSVTVSSNTASTSTANNANTSAITSGRTYKFTPGLPVCASSLSPSAGATGVVPTATLSWAPGTSGGYPSTYDVYFGTSATPPLVSSAQAGTTYTPAAPLSWNTVYYWQVVPRTATGAATGCAVTAFTTAPLLAFDVARLTGISYSSIASSGNIVASWRNGTGTDDNLSNSVPIGFNFNYQGVACSNVLVSTNGFITFNTSATANGASSANYAYQNTAFSASDATKSIATLAPFWDDISCQGNSSFQSGLDASIRYLTTGTSPNRVFTVEWIAMEAATITGADLNFQVKLFESTNVIEFVYGTMTGFFGNINPSTAPLYNYTTGINAWNVTSGTSVGEVITQQVHNTRFFKDSTAKAVNNLLTVPACNSLVRFTPGTYTAYVPPASAVPANDAPANAVAVNVNTEPCTNLCGGVYSTAGATSSGITVQTGLGVADDDVWFKFVATQAQTSIRVYGGTNFDPSVEVFSTLPTNATTRIGYSGTVGTGFSETVNLTTLVPGNTYYFRVFHYGVGYVSSGTLGGDFAVCVYATPPAPANDNCAGAIGLTIGTLCNGITGKTLAATGSTGMTSCTGTPAPNSDDDVWYSFQAVTTTTTVTVQSGHKFNAVLQVFSGTCGSLTSLSCTDATKNAQSESVTFNNLVVGSTYFVRIYNFSSGAGRGSFTVCVTAPPPSCATNFNPPNMGYNIPAYGTTLSWGRVTGATGYDVYLDTINPPVVQIGSNLPDTFISAGYLERNATYFYRVAPRNIAGPNNSCSSVFFATEPPGYNLVIRAFLQSYYKTSSDSMIPTINPLTTDTVADTLFVELHNSVAPYGLEYRTFCLLNTTGTGYAEFPQPALMQTYYIVLKHRNHLETWSSVPFYFDTPDTTYDFSSSLTSAYGSNLVQLKPGVFGLAAGDVNQDGNINAADLTTMGAATGSFFTSYRREDLSGDHMVEGADYSYLENVVFPNRSVLKPQ
ncbi:MAG: hypothetical protein RL213_768 [Bacteroidota bacterium]